jgi:hypothetical protein
MGLFGCLDRLCGPGSLRTQSGLDGSCCSGCRQIIHLCSWQLLHSSRRRIVTLAHYSESGTRITAKPGTLLSGAFKGGSAHLACRRLVSHNGSETRIWAKPAGPAQFSVAHSRAGPWISPVAGSSLTMGRRLGSRQSPAHFSVAQSRAGPCISPVVGSSRTSGLDSDLGKARHISQWRNQERVRVSRQSPARHSLQAMTRIPTKPGTFLSGAIKGGFVHCCISPVVCSSLTAGRDSDLGEAWHTPQWRNQGRVHVSRLSSARRRQHGSHCYGQHGPQRRPGSAVGTHTRLNQPARQYHLCVSHDPGSDPEDQSLSRFPPPSAAAPAGGGRRNLRAAGPPAGGPERFRADHKLLLRTHAPSSHYINVFVRNMYCLAFTQIIYLPVVCINPHAVYLVIPASFLLGSSRCSSAPETTLPSLDQLFFSPATSFSCGTPGPTHPLVVLMGPLQSAGSSSSGFLGPARRAGSLCFASAWSRTGVCLALPQLLAPGSAPLLSPLSASARAGPAGWPTPPCRVQSRPRSPPPSASHPVRAAPAARPRSVVPSMHSIGPNVVKQGPLRLVTALRIDASESAQASWPARNPVSSSWEGRLTAVRARSPHGTTSYG